MKFYRTKENNLVNLEEAMMIYRDPETELYRVAFKNGTTFEMPEIDKEDIDRIMEYNDYLIDFQ